MFRLLISSVLFSTAIAQLQCTDGASTGPAIFGCQTGEVEVTNPATGEQECCPTASVFEPTTAAPVTSPATSIATDAAGSTVIVTVASTAATTASGGVTAQTAAGTSCVDRTNPRTGVSDCPTLAYLCNDANYITIMTQQCPRTCGRCTSTGSTGSSGTCVDLTNPRTGVSDCPSLARLCNDSNYYSLMTTQCPRTCGRCSGSTGSTTAGTATTTASSGTCADRVNPATGVSECPARRALCTNSAYLTLMREQCPRTCGFC